MTQQEGSELKANQINYEIEAIQLNKIDEESVENSSSGSSGNDSLSFVSNIEDSPNQKTESPNVE